ncbi:MAG: hypothetical protein PHX21_08540 [bacterium]|nr:hypothetical protein [bacterium]
MWVKKYLIPFIIFCGLTAIMTYPLVIRMHNSVVVGLNDPLFCAWTLAWDHHKLISGLYNFWDANIFYPFTNTLAYSEHIIGLAVITLPVTLIFKNPVLSYNSILILSFILSGFGMYLLVLYLTKNKYAGMLSGIIFTFSQFHFAQIIHLHIMSFQWIPFALLYLHKFFDTRKYKHLLLFALFFVLQCLCCSQYGVFLAVFVLLFIGLFLFSKQRFKSLKLWLQLGLAGIVIISTLLPFSYPYLKLQKETGASRDLWEIEYHSADVLSYILTNSNSILYGKFTPTAQKWAKIGHWRRIEKGERVKSTESTLFPGLMAILLSMLSFKLVRNTGKINASKFYSKWFPFTFNLLLLVSLCISIYIFIGKGISVLGIPPQSYSLRKPILFIVFLVTMRLIIDKQWRLKWSNFLSSMSENQRFYLFVGILGFLISLGPSIFIAGKKIWYWWTPYTFLYKFFPGFQGIRAISRIGLFALLGISVLAGYGVDKIQKLKPNLQKHKIGFYLIICMVILFENLCIPMPFFRIPCKSEFPQVYKWLAKEEGDFPIIELPMCYEPQYMYYSTCHWKKLVNGCIGFFPPGYNLTTHLMDKFPSEKSIRLLKNLKVKYIIIHPRLYEKEDWEKMSKQFSLYENEVCLVKNFNPDLVYKLTETEICK